LSNVKLLYLIILYLWKTSENFPEKFNGNFPEKYEIFRTNFPSHITNGTGIKFVVTHYRTSLISQYLNDLRLKVQGVNQLGYHLAKSCLRFKKKQILSQQRIDPRIQNPWHRYTELYSDLGDWPIRSTVIL